ncbi:class I tRNA ligase family protein [Candidatus Parcubacteria bacterium]|nr:class I tRNA ligase family protein [Candidatus Parcubacteria bacterium]
MQKYNPQKIEKKWQKKWYGSTVFKAQDKSKKKKFYLMVEFPFPSGVGLHVGHCRPYIGLDIITRKRRMEGQNVLFPMGWDAFGLPAENYAIKMGIHPSVSVKKNIANYKKQMKNLGLSFDWSREVNTTDPGYYKWTQWIFLQLFKKGLAHKEALTINWCPKDKIGLANEEVIAGKCERCGTPVEKRDKVQWVIKITKYADRLIKDLGKVDYQQRIKDQQINWIGRSEGAEIEFLLDFKKDPKLNENRGPKGERAAIKVFTTRPDTLFGATYLVLAPEHPWVTLATDQNHDVLSNKKEVADYAKSIKNKPEIERTAEGKEKTGVEIQGVVAINPATGKEIPMYVADYVLAQYGTGAVMAVPAHDERDYEFAKKYNLPIEEVLVPNIIDKRNPPVVGKQFVERKNVHAIVKDPKTGKYLALKWRKFDWTTFPMGGMEEGESAVDAAMREVKEETGFTNLKLVRVLPGQVRAEYFAAHKDQNRISYTTAVVFELVDHTQVDIDQKEKDGHDIIWLDESKLNYENMTHAEVEQWKQKISAKIPAYQGDGVLINSGEFTGMDSVEAKSKIIRLVGAKPTITYKLRDWVFSRQHYWGEPIPMIHCKDCGWQPVPEKDLPVTLPNVKKYQPTDTGESPLAVMEKWVNVKCPKCKGPAKRETDTMPNWAGSNWYFLRYVDPKNSKKLADEKKLKYWMPIDWYNGGMEHTTLHLLYSRFIYKFLWDIGAVPKSLGNEPYKKRTSHGIILAEGGVKMSKSLGNVVNPDDVSKQYGADTMRVYEMFMGPFEQMIPWDSKGVVGARRFLEKIYTLAHPPSHKASAGRSQKEFTKKEDANIAGLLNKTIKKVSEDIEAMKFNTAISSLMILVNAFYEASGNITKENLKTLLVLVSPFAPHLPEELWQEVGGKGLCSQQAWPKYNKKLIKEEAILLIVQINGKVRDKLEVTAGMDQKELEKMVLASPKIKQLVGASGVKKIISVPNKLINIVL